MKWVFAFTALCVFTISGARAVILFDTGVPSVNTTAPGGPLTNSGWQYEGQWGGYLGTPIAPHFFVSAAHIGQAGSNLIFLESTYTIVRSFSLPGASTHLFARLRVTRPSAPVVQPAKRGNSKSPIIAAPGRRPRQNYIRPRAL